MKLRRPSGPWITSIAIHVVVAAIFIQAILARHSFFMMFSQPTPPPVVQRIGFLTLPQPKLKGPARVGRNGGDGLSNKATVVPPQAAPTAVPTTLPPVPKGPPVTSIGPSSGPLIGGGGQLRGVQPRYEDPRVWVTPGEIAAAPKTPAQRLDSIIANDIGIFNDSVRIANSGRKPGDWTFEKNGKKYGIDSKYIHLGSFSIPTAVLAMLPINVAGNPTTYERSRTLTSRHDEIFEQAQRGINDADFNKAVREIRERKERERKEAEEIKKKAAEETASPSVPN
jgi:hypothetical protein